jgi:acetoin utilization protein AcuC
VDGQRRTYAVLHDLAHRHAGGRWIATGGGGYAIVDVVPRAWTHLLAEMSGPALDPDTETPASWREHVAGRHGRAAPLTMTDGVLPRWRDWAEGHDPADPLDRAVLATLGAQQNAGSGSATGP